jgi:hypothetical protein
MPVGGVRSTHFCASSSEALVLAQIEGALLIAIQAHNRNLTLSIAIRKSITDKFKVTRTSPLNDRIKVLTELGLRRSVHNLLRINSSGYDVGKYHSPFFHLPSLDRLGYSDDSRRH